VSAKASHDEVEYGEASYGSTYGIIVDLFVRAVTLDVLHVTLLDAPVAVLRLGNALQLVDKFVGRLGGARPNSCYTMRDIVSVASRRVDQQILSTAI